MTIMRKLNYCSFFKSWHNIKYESVHFRMMLKCSWNPIAASLWQGDVLGKNEQECQRYMPTVYNLNNATQDTKIIPAAHLKQVDTYMAATV